MATVIAGVTISLDGFVADASGNSARLYTDLADLRGSPYMNALIEETGAVLMGRGSFEMADPDSYVGNYEFQVPIFVLTHHPPAVPPKQDDRLTLTFVSDGVDSATVFGSGAFQTERLRARRRTIDRPGRARRWSGQR
jgi:dihydrofolate reductase